MEISGKIFKVLPLESGEGQRGKWQKQQIIIETDNGKFPKKICVTLWGDLINNSLQEGKDISVEFDVESREFNGRWYTDVKAWRINRIEGGQGNSNSAYTNNSGQKPSYSQPAVQAQQISSAPIDDDLPF
jgi:hypothetical protein